MLPSLLTDSDDAKLRVQLKYQSKFASHQFRRVRLSLTDAAPTVPTDQKITLGPLHSAGPFAVESASPGYGRKFASQQSEFKADEVFNHEDRPYRWQHRADLMEVDVNDLPVIADRASVVVLHQNIKAPAPQKATLLIGSDDGHVVYLGGKQVGILKGPRKLNPLAQEYELDLKKGDNDLYVKVVNHDGPSQLTFAFRSPAIDVPEQMVKLLKVPANERSPEVQSALRKYYRSVFCLHPDWLALVDQEKGIQKTKEKLLSEIPTTLVWKELDKPREAHMLIRGQYDKPGDRVERATPAFLPSFPTDAPLTASAWPSG